MKTFASYLADHKCGNCGLLQSLFAVGLTFKGGVKDARMQEFISCQDCGAHLRLTHKGSRNSVLWAQIGGPVLFAIICLGLLVVLVTSSGSFIGMLFAIVIWWILATLLGMVMSGLASRFFYKLEVIG